MKKIPKNSKKLSNIILINSQVIIVVIILFTKLIHFKSLYFLAVAAQA